MIIQNDLAGYTALSFHLPGIFVKGILSTFNYPEKNKQQTEGGSF
jgi:hypothetical protein